MRFKASIRNINTFNSNSRSSAGAPKPCWRVSFQGWPRPFHLWVKMSGFSSTMSNCASPLSRSRAVKSGRTFNVLLLGWHNRRPDFCLGSLPLWAMLPTFFKALTSIDWVRLGHNLRNLHHPICRWEQHDKSPHTPRTPPPCSSIRSHRLLCLHPLDEKRQYTPAFPDYHNQ